MPDALTRRYLESVATDHETLELLTRLCGASPLVQQTIPFSGRVLLRPMLLAGEDLAPLVRDLLDIFDLLASLPERLFDGDLRRYAAAVGLTPIEADMAVRMATPWPPVFLGRADLYRDAGGFKLLEFNLGSSLGGYQTGELNRIMLQADLVREFADREGLRYVDTMPILADMLRRSQPGSYGRPGPVVAITEWPDTFSEWGPTVRSLAARLREFGVDARHCHLGQLREEHGSLTLDGTPVDTVFRHFTMAEVIGTRDGPSLVEPVVRAHERGVADMFTPLSHALLGNKLALTLLCEERHRDTFTSQELALVDRLLPWTRRLATGRVHIDGGEVDLLDLCLERKDELVLKAATQFGGRGVHTGWTMGERDWAAAVEAAMDGPFVVQERVVPVPEPIPDPRTGALEPWIVNWGLFLTAGGYSGSFLRASSQPDAGIVNYHGGAWTGTCFFTDSGPC